jgi:hypothetical protein
VEFDGIGVSVESVTSTNAESRPQGESVMELYPHAAEKCDGKCDGSRALCAEPHAGAEELHALVQVPTIVCR